MARTPTPDRGITAETLPCRDCAGKCDACRSKKRKTCPACPCSSCEKCKGKGHVPTGKWVVTTWDGNTRHRETALTLTAAKNLKARRKNEVFEGRFFPERVGRRKRPRVSTIIDAYMPLSAEKLTHRDDLIFAKEWKTALGDRYADEVKPADLEAWRTKRAEQTGNSPARLNRYTAFLKRVYNVAIRDGRLTCANPVSRMTKLKENNARTRYLSEDEERTLLAALTPRWVRFCCLLVLTGFRMQELLSLRWDCVDLVGGVITIPRSKHGEKRHLPLSDDVRELLLQEPSRGQSAWVFPAARNPETHMPYWTFRNVWVKALENAGLEDKDLHAHDLRHTFGSRLVMAGVDLRTVQELMVSP